MTASVLRFLQAHGLLDDRAGARVTALTGGVASDILLVDAAGRGIVVKRALARLRVAQDWQVPTERNAHEVAWLYRAAAIVPGCVPDVLAHDPAAGMFAMRFLDPATHPVWKQELRAGRADPAFAAAVGRTLVAIHAATAADPSMPAAFAHQALFRAIRLDPYLAASAQAHPDLALPLEALSRAVDGSRMALVHGDVSPKNILCAPGGTPVFLDAECACCGDPAFDAAFCLTHLLLKTFLAPQAVEVLLRCVAAFADAWRDGVAWEDPSAAEARVAALLPALLLARVDGKSPVEYLSPIQRDAVRGFARAMLSGAGLQLPGLVRAWRTTLRAAGQIATG